MKILAIAPQPFFSPRGTPFSVYYRTLIASELGFSVDLLTYGEGQDVDLPGVRIIRIPRFRLLGNAKTGPSTLKLFLDQFMIIWTIGLLLRNRYAVVHAHEEAVFWVRFLKPIFGFKLIYDMHSSLPQQLSNFKFSKSRLLIWIFQKLEDTAIHAADAVITICPALADHVDSLIGKHEKHFLIENSIFEDVRLAQEMKDGISEQIKSDELKPILLPEGRKLVVYIGTLEAYQGIDILIQAFSKVLQANSEAYLVVVGGNPEQVNKYKSLAEENGLGRDVAFTGRVPQTLAKHYNTLATVITSPRSAGTNTPLKVYEQLASGKPLVATRIYSHTQVLDDDVSFLVEPEPEDMARGIIEALSERDSVTAKINNARQLYEEKYSRHAYVEKMRRLMELIS